MAKCKTCGKKIRIPEGWTVGPAVRHHYWTKHRERMLQSRIDRDANASIPKRSKRSVRTPKGAKSAK